MTLTGNVGTACLECIDGGRLPAGWQRSTGVVGGDYPCDNCGRRRWDCVTVALRPPRDPGKPPLPPDNPSYVSGYGRPRTRAFAVVAAVMAVIVAITLLFAPDHDQPPSDCESIELTTNGHSQTYVPEGCG